jgi:hypothetical protein
VTAGFVAAAATGDNWGGDSDTTEFWQHVLGADIKEWPSDEFAEAFADAATDVFSELNDKL